MASDEQLLRAFAGGDQRSLAELAERYERGLLSLSVAILGSADRGLDAVQETWVRVIRYAGSFQGQSSVKTWLYRIAINQCRSMLGGKEGEAQALPELADERSSNPADRAAACDDAERLKRAVERLSLALRETILLCYTHGLTHAEAAEVMAVPIGTVKSRVNAGLARLREQLADSA